MAFTVENLQLVLVFIVPGFIALKVYSLFVPTDGNFSDRILEAITYGMINLALFSWLVFLLREQITFEAFPVWNLVLTFTILAVTPALLALAVYKIRRTKFFLTFLRDQTPSGWDYFFQKRIACFALIHLKSGHKIGGFFGEQSLASAFPREPDLYLESVWTLDDNDWFSEASPGSAGCYVRMVDIELIEYFKAEES